MFVKSNQTKDHILPPVITLSMLVFKQIAPRHLTCRITPCLITGPKLMINVLEDIKRGCKTDKPQMNHLGAKVLLLSEQIYKLLVERRWQLLRVCDLCKLECEHGCFQ